MRNTKRSDFVLSISSPSHLQLAYCGNMEIGGSSSQDPTRKSVLIGVLQMLGVTEDVVMVDSDSEVIKVNDINLPGDPDALGNHHQSDNDGGISGINKGHYTISPCKVASQNSKTRNSVMSRFSTVSQALLCTDSEISH